jgi:thioredoxin reductase (NADPH)
LEKEAIDVHKKDNGFAVKTKDEEFFCRALIFTTGATHRELPVPGAKEFLNKGVHYCALCDGPFYKGKKVAVIGGSDSAVIETLTLSKYVKKAYIIYRKDKLRAEQRNLDMLNKCDNVEIIYNTNVTEIKGDQFVNRIALDNPYEGKNEMEVDAVFIAIGYIPISELAEKLGVELNDYRQIKINRRSETNISGVYAAGDVTDAEFKQIATGIGEGINAAFNASKYVG